MAKYTQETAKTISLPLLHSDYAWLTDQAFSRGLTRSAFIRQEILRMKSEAERSHAHSQ